jgi:allantoinase
MCSKVVDLLLSGGTIVSDTGLLKASVAVDNGKVVSVTTSDSLPADVRVDASGLFLLPGLIDTHVHFRDPGMVQKEDFVTGTRSAAKGGVTTVFDMPTTFPIVTSRQRFLEKLSVVKPKSIVDFGLYGGVGTANLSELDGMKEVGAIAFKTYMVAPPSDRVREYEGTFVTDAASLHRVMLKVRETNKLLCIHAEDDNLIRHLSEELQVEGRRDPLAHADSRPGFTEARAVSDALILSKATATRVHLLHLSSREAIEEIRVAKKNGSIVSCETCPHYLLLTKDVLRKLGPLAKFNPPPREKADCESVWQGISDGTVDMIVSDHAPHTKAEKDEGANSIWKAPPGTPGVETRLPLLLTQIGKGRLSLEDVVRLCSTNPAIIFGIYPRKGTIAVGSDADIILVDAKRKWALKSEDLETKAKGTFLFENWEVEGKCTATYLRGQLIMEDDQILADPGIGEFIRN